MMAGVIGMGVTGWLANVRAHGRLVGCHYNASRSSQVYELHWCWLDWAYHEPACRSQWDACKVCYHNQEFVDGGSCED